MKIKIIEDKPPTLKDAQAFVGGFVQCITLDDDSQMLMDEEGKLKNKSINHKATELARSVLFPRDYIAGDVLILKGPARWR